MRKSKCDAPTIRCDDLDGAVLDALQSQPLNEAAIQRIWKQIGDPLADPLLQALRDEVIEKTRRQKNLVSNFEDRPSLPKAVQARYYELELQIAQASHRLATLELSRTNQLPRNVTELKQRLTLLANRLHSVDRKELRVAIHAFVAEIVLYSKERKAGRLYPTDSANCTERLFIRELRGMDLNHRPSGYEPDELPDCSTPHA